MLLEYKAMTFWNQLFLHNLVKLSLESAFWNDAFTSKNLSFLTTSLYTGSTRMRPLKNLNFRSLINDFFFQFITVFNTQDKNYIITFPKTTA